LPRTLYVGASYAYGLRASDGHIVWRFGPSSGAQFWQPTASAAAGVVIIGSSDVGRFNIHPFGIGSNELLYALDARTGRLYWRTPGIEDYPPLLYSS
jgi:outer membrane protein assembly factor BamB